MEQKQEKEYPESFYCPLTQELMDDPVVDPEGNSYEREAIEKWLEKDPTSPITRTALTKGDLVPNRALKDAIDEKRKENGDEVKQKPKKAEEPKQEQKESKKEAAEQPAIVANEDGVSLVASAQKVKDGEYDVLISVKNPVGAARTPIDIVAVVDVSGSMGTEATIKNEDGKTEGFGLSLLDIVKHAVTTIVNALGPQDRFALVTYSDTAETVVNLGAVGNKADLHKKIEALKPLDRTNIWDGLQMGLDILKKAPVQKGVARLSSLLLLTDGLPNISPPSGEVARLKRYKDEVQVLPCNIMTFGFGYGINSQLLQGLALEGDGLYAFIPDSSFVGTAFVNCASNLLSTFARNPELALEPTNGASLVLEPEIEDLPVDSKSTNVQQTSWGAQIDLCSLQYDQSKDVVVRVKVPNVDDNKPFLNATLKYKLKDGTQKTAEIKISKVENSKDVEYHKFRGLTVKSIKNAMEAKDPTKSLQAVKDLVKQATATASFKSGEKRMKDLVADIEGQIVEALSKDAYYQKWGRHYLPSLARAHQLQQCNNFKDPGVQNYGGKLFTSLRNEIEDIFVKIPAPKPSIKKYEPSSSGGKGAPAVSKPVSMSTYYRSSGPCFAGECAVQMADGTTKQVQQIMKGDLVSTGNGAAEVLCVLKTICHKGKTQIVELSGGLLVTPYHPVRIQGKWTFPCDLAAPSERNCAAIYSFLLKEHHVMIINGVECVSLAHGIEGDAVVSHPYFGTNAVVEDLKGMAGWESGLVQLYAGCLVRDEQTNLVCKMTPRKPQRIGILSLNGDAIAA
eukprot:TRINITY_DN908_c0_g1_i1.p1 TRINITY_DN908_c0_g1~~TRINITY_DN908_c0_g1_i1.p1  ORF type:complete len:832 (+),score=277.31 TRINITY_DN908_c0_g1_i1:122-2497(+)